MTRNLTFYIINFVELIIMQTSILMFNYRYCSIAKRLLPFKSQ